MGWVSGIVVYLLVWWMVVFMVLPWGLERDDEGKPLNPRLKQKVILTTIISSVIWLIIYALIEIEIISFREIAATMAET